MSGWGEVLILAGAEICSTMDQFSQYENIYFKLSATVKKFIKHFTTGFYMAKLDEIGYQF